MCPKKLNLNLKKKRLTIECDEVWSFVGNKENKYWIWLAIDRETRQIVGGLLVIVQKKGLKVYGRPCLLFIVNVRFVIPIFGRLMKRYYPPNIIEQLANKVGKQTLFNALLYFTATSFSLST